MSKYKGTKTEQNLLTAFAGESQARNKYTYFASKAKKEGYNQISQVFSKTADNEKEHAKLWFKALNDDKIADTYNNLIEAAAGEHGEWTEMYKEFAETAREEGFNDLAFLFEGVADIESEHEKRYLKLAEDLKNHKLYTSDKEESWICTNCGYTVTAKDAPKVCPICKHPQGFFQIKNDTN